MTFADALAALLRGGKVRRPSFGEDCWVLDVYICWDRSGECAIMGRDRLEATDWEEVTG